MIYASKGNLQIKSKGDVIMIFVSYSWVESKPDGNVLNFVADLRQRGYDASCDVYFMQQEASISFAEMMADKLKNSDKVIIILTESYKSKADSFKGGVGDEYRYIITDIKNNRKKYILISFEDNLSKVVPDFLIGREVIFIDKESRNYDQLIFKLNESPEYIFPDVNPTKEMPSPKLLKGLEGDSNNTQQTIEIVDDETKARLALEKEADLGNIDAIIQCGLFCDENADYKKAITWFEKALSHENSIAYYQLGLYFAKGFGVKRDVEKALSYFEKAGELGNVDAMIECARTFNKKIESEKHDDLHQIEMAKKAIYWFKKAIPFNNEIANYYMGIYYRNGFGVERSESESFSHFLASAKLGYVDGMVECGRIFNEKMDYEQSIYWFKKAVEYNDPIANYYMGSYYNEGVGVEKDESLALLHFEKSAEYGVDDSMVECGKIYDERKDYINSTQWFNRALRKDNPLAQYFMGFYYKDGTGVEKDEKKSFELMFKAAKQEMGHAQFLVAVFYEFGHGCVQNLVSAIEWYEKALANGIENAKENLSRIKDSKMELYEKIKQWQHAGEVIESANKIIPKTTSVIHGLERKKKIAGRGLLIISVFVLPIGLFFNIPFLGANFDVGNFSVPAVILIVAAILFLALIKRRITFQRTEYQIFEHTNSIKEHTTQKKEALKCIEDFPVKFTSGEEMPLDDKLTIITLTMEAIKKKELSSEYLTVDSLISQYNKYKLEQARKAEKAAVEEREKAAKKEKQDIIDSLNKGHLFRCAHYPGTKCLFGHPRLRPNGCDSMPACPNWSKVIGSWGDF